MFACPGLKTDQLSVTIVIRVSFFIIVTLLTFLLSRRLFVGDSCPDPTAVRSINRAIAALQGAVTVVASGKDASPRATELRKLLL